MLLFFVNCYPNLWNFGALTGKKQRNNAPNNNRLHGCHRTNYSRCNLIISKQTKQWPTCFCYFLSILRLRLQNVSVQVAYSLIKYLIHALFCYCSEDGRVYILFHVPMCDSVGRASEICDEMRNFLCVLLPVDRWRHCARMIKIQNKHYLQKLLIGSGMAKCYLQETSAINEFFCFGLLTSKCIGG